MHALERCNSNVYIPNWRYDDKMMLKFMQKRLAWRGEERKKNSFLTLNCFQCYLHEKFMHFIFHNKSADFYFTITPLTFQRNKKNICTRERKIRSEKNHFSEMIFYYRTRCINLTALLIPFLIITLNIAYF